MTPLIQKKKKTSSAVLDRELILIWFVWYTYYQVGALLYKFISLPKLEADDDSPEHVTLPDSEHLKSSEGMKTISVLEVWSQDYRLTDLNYGLKDQWLTFI